MKRLILWIQTLTLLVDQGLWTQVSILHLFCAKAVSECLQTISGFGPVVIHCFAFKIDELSWNYYTTYHTETILGVNVEFVSQIQIDHPAWFSGAFYRYHVTLIKPLNRLNCIDKTLDKNP